MVDFPHISHRSLNNIQHSLEILSTLVWHLKSSGSFELAKMIEGQVQAISINTDLIEKNISEHITQWIRDVENNSRALLEMALLKGD